MPLARIGRVFWLRKGAVATILALLVALWMPSASATPAPVKPGDAQIAAAAAQRRTDIANLGRLSAQIAAIDGEIDRQRLALDAAVKHYNDTSHALQQAVATADARTKDVDAARAAFDKARLAAQAQARTAYMNLGDSSSALISAENPNQVVAAADYRRYVVAHQRNAFTDLSIARIAASNSEAEARAAEDRRRVLEQDATDQRDKIVAGLKAFQGRKVELAKQRVLLNQQSTVTFGRLNKLLNQQAAYAAWTQQQAAIAAAEAARQAALTRAGVASAATPVLAPASGGTWGNPMAAGSYTISSCFCARWGTFHYGVDFAAAYGTPMYSVGAGTVVAAGPAQGFGNWVVIDHGTGELSVYGHMKTYLVSVGQHVVRGQMIAYVGTEGDSTGPHLHLEIRVGGVDGTRIDPQVWLAQRGVYI